MGLQSGGLKSRRQKKKQKLGLKGGKGSPPITRGGKGKRNSLCPFQKKGEAVNTPEGGRGKENWKNQLPFFVLDIS